MDNPIEIPDSPAQEDLPITRAGSFTPIKIDLPEQTNEESRSKRFLWMEALWNLDRKRFPLLVHRIRHGEDPKKDSIVWKQQKVADLLREHDKDSLKIVQRTIYHEDPKKPPSIMSSKGSFTVKVKQEKIDTETVINIAKPIERKGPKVPTFADNLKGLTDPPPNLCIPKIEIPDEEVDYRTSYASTNEIESQNRNIKSPSQSLPVDYDNFPPKELLTPKVEPVEEEVDYRKTYNYPDIESSSVETEESFKRGVKRHMSSTVDESTTVKLRMTLDRGTSQRAVESFEYSETEVEKERGDLLETISARLREAKVKSKYVPCIAPEKDLNDIANPDSCIDGFDGVSALKDKKIFSPVRPPPSCTQQECYSFPQYSSDALERGLSNTSFERRSYFSDNSAMDFEPENEEGGYGRPRYSMGRGWETSNNSLDQFTNRKGKNRFSVPISQKYATRDCLLCHIRTKDMKKHTILNHLTNTWWGTYGPYTCWRCQEYHPGGDITLCGGQYKEGDLSTFLYRNQCFESFVKEDLECQTDQDLIMLIKRNGLCDRSLSSFSTMEEDYMRAIDDNKGLPYKLIYTAANPTRVSELYHWRTIAEILNFSNIRGIITGNIQPQYPINLIDSMVNLPEPYMSSAYGGDLAHFIRYNSPFPNKTKSVITDITGNNLLNESLREKLKADENIKISVGISSAQASRCSNQLIQAVEKWLIDPKVVAIGSTGLDGNLPGTLSSQEAIFISMLRISKRTRIPIRIFSKGLHEKTLMIMKDQLPRGHKIHYSNPTMTIDQAVEVLTHFPESFLGVFGRNVLVQDTGHEIIRRIQLSKLIPASYAFMDPADATLNKFDLERIVIQIGIIKGLSRHEVARNLRLNIKSLYQF